MTDRRAGEIWIGAILMQILRFAKWTAFRADAWPCLKRMAILKPAKLDTDSHTARHMYSGCAWEASRMRNFIKRLLSEERGATAIEYGLIAGLIAVVIIGALTVTGTSLKSVFESVSGQLETVADSSGGSGGGGATP